MRLAEILPDHERRRDLDQREVVNERLRVNHIVGEGRLARDWPEQRVFSAGHGCGACFLRRPAELGADAELANKRVRLGLYSLNLVALATYPR